MATSVGGSAGYPSALDPIQDLLGRAGRHWGAVLFDAVVSLVLGIMILAWPGITLLVVAVLFSLHLLVRGVIEIMQAFAEPVAGGGERVLFVLLGALSVVVGLLCLRSPLQTLAVIALLIGTWWLVTGVVDLVRAFGPDQPHRALRALMGLLSIAAGVFVVLDPGISLLTLVWLLGLWRVANGITGIITAFSLRSAARHAAPRVTARRSA